jgi:catechol 2,3-dioxygenase-like lactoylglutathione lyase family enzyme
MNPLQGLDHIALGVQNFQQQCDFFSEVLGMELRRLGKRHATGTQIAMLVDRSSNFKVELIETAPPEEMGLLHLAFRVEDVDGAYRQLAGEGLVSVREPHDLAAAKARTALLQHPSGMNIQIIQYAPDSPDL